MKDCDLFDETFKFRSNKKVFNKLIPMSMEAFIVNIFLPFLFNMLNVFEGIYIAKI